MVIDRHAVPSLLDVFDNVKLHLAEWLAPSLLTLQHADNMKPGRAFNEVAKLTDLEREECLVNRSRFECPPRSPVVEPAFFLLSSRATSPWQSL